MKISTKGRYAVRLMLDIAMHDQNEPVRLKDVAERQDISVKYLEQIISQLVKAGFVQSVRGAQGGYLLIGVPKDYTVGRIIREVEGDMAPVACLEPGYPNCGRSSECVTLRVWKELDDAIQGVLDKYTLADLVNWQEDLDTDYII
jgi:Rrf2 family protein